MIKTLSNRFAYVLDKVSLIQVNSATPDHCTPNFYRLRRTICLVPVPCIQRTMRRPATTDLYRSTHDAIYHVISIMYAGQTRV